MSKTSWSLREVATLLFLISWGASSAAADADANADAMRQAARSLSYSEPVSIYGNRAFMLEKQDTVIANVADNVPTDVAVVFGYADNRAACEQIARVLTASGVAGSFKCYPIH